MRLNHSNSVIEDLTGPSLAPLPLRQILTADPTNEPLDNTSGCLVFDPFENHFLCDFGVFLGEVKKGHKILKPFLENVMFLKEPDEVQVRVGYARCLEAGNDSSLYFFPASAFNRQKFSMADRPS